MNWKVPKIWKGGDVWILGGGPSIVQQFDIPQEVVNRVKTKQSPPSSYSQYLSFLHDKHVIGVNVSYLIGDWIDMIYFGDGSFLTSHAKQLRMHPAIKVSSAPVTRLFEWIKYLSRERTKPTGISTRPDTVAWNQNSGAAAISLAVHAGAKRIFLLGFDMNLIKDTQHWHSEYRTNGGRSKALPFDRHLKGFPQIAADAMILGVEIINVCPSSAITVFKKATLKEVRSWL